MHHCIIYFYWVDDILKVDTHVCATSLHPFSRGTTFHNTHPLTHYQNAGESSQTHSYCRRTTTTTPSHHHAISLSHHHTTSPPTPPHHLTPNTATCTLTNLTDEQCHDEHSQEIIEHGEGVLWCVSGIRKVVVDGCQRQQRPVETPDVAKDNNSTTDQRTYNAAIFKQIVSSKYPPHSSLVLPLSAASLIKASTPHSAPHLLT